jgi:glycerol uptake facilitator-like aquaporin
MVDGKRLPATRCLHSTTPGRLWARFSHEAGREVVGGCTKLPRGGGGSTAASAAARLATGQLDSSSSGRAALAPAAVGAYIGSAYWFTSSTSFANPAVTIGRAFSDTFAGIAPTSVPGFVIAQVVGATAGVGLLALLCPRAGRAADEVVTPHIDTTASTGASK